MERARVGGALVIISALLGTVPSHAQTEVSADLGLYSSYIWRGLTLTNKPVAQPAVYLSIPVGNASLTLGGWSTIDLGKYDDPANDISESGGTSAFNLAEFDPIVEVSFPVGKATLTGGGTAYIYPNDLDGITNNGGLDSEFNTVELYGKAALDAPLSPFVNLYYDVDKVKGAYIEGGVSHSFPASEKVSIDLGALAGFSAGQDADLDALGAPQAEFYNFAENGLTHVDLSAGTSFSAGAFSFSPVLHVIITSDELTKISSPSNIDKGAKLWGGVTISWSKALGEAPAEAAE